MSLHDSHRNTALPPDEPGSTPPGHERGSASPDSEAVSPSPDEATRTSQPTCEPTAGPGSPLAAAPQRRDPTRYRILGEHGRGGIGRVSRAHDVELGRDVAIKELISRGNVSEVRFLREALITARLEHPGIVPVHEAGRWPDGTPFYAMKLVAGRPLRDLIAERKTVDERIGLLHHVIALADAIAYAHGRNIIHRDLKPSNVIVGEFGETVVIDWGLAKDLTAAEESTIGGGPFREVLDEGLTSAGTVLGTPAYMAPEQARGEPVDQRADVYAIGAMLWELCTLERMPPAYAGQRRRILRRAGIDLDLVTIIDKAIDPAPARRYADAGGLAADLKAFKEGARIASRRYSPWAMLVHWTRRHRAMTLSAIGLIVLSAIASAVYVRNISVERDRADATLVIARRDLDRAQLAEASLLLDKDPTRANDLLTSMSQHSPQYALLRSRATQAAATNVIELSALTTDLLRNPVTSEIVMRTVDGLLESLDLEAGRLRSLDSNLLGPLTADREGWTYARRAFRTSDVTIRSTSPRRDMSAGSRLSSLTDQLLVAGAHIYVLHEHDLHMLDKRDWTLVRRDVRSVAGSAHFLMVCSTTNELEIMRDGLLERRTHCASNKSFKPLAATDASYAALLDTSTLLLVRGDQVLELPTHISGSYELVLDQGGLLALADYSDKAWFVRPGSNQLELAPLHGSSPTAVAVGGRFAAWGYADGTIVAIDTATSATWQFKGHDSRITGVTIDPDANHPRVITIGGTELRIWPLTPSPLRQFTSTPCTVYNTARSPDRTQIAMDCSDGIVRVWTLATGIIHEVHRHSDVAYGVAWWRDSVCSAGFDNQLLCTSSGETTRTMFSSKTQIRWITSTPDHRTLAIATADGQLRTLDDTLLVRYEHSAPIYRVAIDPDGQLLASGDDDGTLIVYDLRRGSIARKPHVHAGRVLSVAWRENDLWTSSSDGTMLRWRYHDHAASLLERFQDTGSFRFLHPLDIGWCGNSGSKYLLISARSASSVLRFDLGRHVARIEVSPNERYIATAAAGELIVVDLMRHSVASLAMGLEGTGYAGFVDDDLIAIGTPRGLFLVHPQQLTYIDFKPQPKQPTTSDISP